MVEVSAEEFERLVDEALDEVPDEIAALVENLVVLVEAEAPPEDPDLLGLYEGVALTDRDGSYGLELPARILIFRDNLLAACETTDELVREVRITVVHEIAHHFGIEEERLHELGYG